MRAFALFFFKSGDVPGILAETGGASMRITSNFTILANACRAGLLCGAFTLSAFAHNSCSTETFKGAYGFTVTGFVLPPLTIGEFGFGGGQGAVPIQGVQLVVSDGKGNLTDKESISLGGQPLAATETNPFSLHYGTYTVDSDCTGTAFLTNAKYVCPSSPDNCPTANTVSLAIVIDKAGKKVRMVAVPPYDAGGIPRVVSSIGEKLDSEEHSDDRDRRW
jgi:hypothetical protein